MTQRAHHQRTVQCRRAKNATNPDTIAANIAPAAMMNAASCPQLGARRLIHRHLRGLLCCDHRVTLVCCELPLQDVVLDRGPRIIAPHACRKARLNLLQRKGVEIGEQLVSVQGHGRPSRSRLS